MTLPKPAPFSPPPPRKTDVVTISRISVNSPNADLAVRCSLTQDVFDQARLLGREIELPLSEQDAWTRPGSWLNLLGSILTADDHRSLDAPVAGYWLACSRLGSHLARAPHGGLTLPLTIKVERCEAPHRDPQLFACAAPRTLKSLQAETLAYWEAHDLRQSLAPLSTPPRKIPSL